MTGTSGRSMMAEYRYSNGAGDLVRLTSDPADDGIRALVELTLGLSGEQLQAVRDSLDTDDMYALLAFARRQAARGLRDGDLGAATVAIDALALVTRDRIDWRDLSVDFPLFAVRELGGDLVAIIDRATERCEPGAAGSFEAKRERSHSLTLADCALVRVSTSHGVGFMDDWTGSRSPPTDLASAVVTLADLIDAEGSYRVRDMRVSDFPGRRSGPGRDVEDVATNGCVSIDADHVASTRRFSHGLLVHVAELPSAPRAADLVRAASEASANDRPRSAVRTGRFTALFIGGSVRVSEAPLETARSLERFLPMARAALADLAT